MLRPWRKLLPIAFAALWPVASYAGSGGDAVSAENLLAREVYWPYRVTLLEPWEPSGSNRPVAANARGVLIRVEADGARVDFGRDGLHRVPVDATDLVERANRVRTAELAKTAPNFVLAVGTRLVDAASDPPVAVHFDDLLEKNLFLCVFADPKAPQFAEIAQELRPLTQRAGLGTILFPQGGHADAAVHRALRASEWSASFVYQHLALAYTQTLVDGDTSFPWMVLQSPEGRVLFEGRPQATNIHQLRALLEEHATSKRAAAVRTGPAFLH
jgi:hypothetical protein